MINDKRYRVLITYSLFPTSIGWCGVLTTQRGLLRLYAGYAERNQLLNHIAGAVDSHKKKVPATGIVIDKIKRYCSGKHVSFEGCKMDWSSLSPFQQKVLKAALKIPYGSVETYGNLARTIGCPRGARAVGNALAKNPFPLVIPCHRIIRGDGKPGGFSAGGGVMLKNKLLQMEQLSIQKNR
jgi:methylated-DNA-[protein]-cysteine S-methyltransferase